MTDFENKQKSLDEGIKTINFIINEINKNHKEEIEKVNNDMKSIEELKKGFKSNNDFHIKKRRKIIQLIQVILIVPLCSLSFYYIYYIFINMQ